MESNYLKAIVYTQHLLDAVNKYKTENCKPVSKPKSKNSRPVFERQKNNVQNNASYLRDARSSVGYILIYELINLTGQRIFKGEWNKEEFESSFLPPRYIMACDVDPTKEEEMLFYALNNECIKKTIQQPPSINNVTPNEDYFKSDWIYMSRSGKYMESHSEVEAAVNWLEEAPVIIEENKRYNEANRKTKRIIEFVRTGLSKGSIKAKQQTHDKLIPTPPSYWDGTECDTIFTLQKIRDDVFFDKASAEKYLEKYLYNRTENEERLIIVTSGSHVKSAKEKVFSACREQSEKINREELQELINRVLKIEGKILSKSWFKSCSIPEDLKRKKGERGKCRLIDNFFI